MFQTAMQVYEVYSFWSYALYDDYLYQLVKDAGWMVFQKLVG